MCVLLNLSLFFFSKEEIEEEVFLLNLVKCHKQVAFKEMPQTGYDFYFPRQKAFLLIRRIDALVADGDGMFCKSVMARIFLHKLNVKCTSSVPHRDSPLQFPLQPNIPTIGYTMLINWYSISVLYY